MTISESLLEAPVIDTDSIPEAHGMGVAIHCGVIVMQLCSGAKVPDLPCAAPNSCALEGFCQYPGRG